MLICAQTQKNLKNMAVIIQLSKLSKSAVKYGLVVNHFGLRWSTKFLFMPISVPALTSKS